MCLFPFKFLKRALERMETDLGIDIVGSCLILGLRSSLAWVRMKADSSAITSPFVCPPLCFRPVRARIFMPLEG